MSLAAAGICLKGWVLFKWCFTFCSLGANEPLSLGFEEHFQLQRGNFKIILLTNSSTPVIFLFFNSSIFTQRDIQTEQFFGGTVPFEHGLWKKKKKKTHENKKKLINDYHIYKAIYIKNVFNTVYTIIMLLCRSPFTLIKQPITNKCWTGSSVSLICSIHIQWSMRRVHDEVFETVFDTIV